MKPFYFSFGFGHHHGQLKLPLAKCYTIIEAEDMNSARQIMFDRRDIYWAGCYEEDSKGATSLRSNAYLIKFESIERQYGQTF